MTADLLIATPAYGGHVTTHYADSIIRLLEALRRQPDIAIRHYFIDSASIAWARNAFATLTLQRPAITHVLFIDADIGFAPTAVLRMLAFDKSFVGCICPSRALDRSRLHQVSRQIDDPALAGRVALDYVTADRLERSPDGRVVANDGFARIQRIGTGLTLLKREVLERLAEAHPELWGEADRGYAAMGVTGRVFQPFHAYQTETGAFMSEDMSFARRWTDLGGEIWACLDEQITHVGTTPFTGAYADRLRFEAGE